MSHVFDTDELIGTQIGRYRIDARIGRGGMGVLYRAEHTGLGRTAALKVIAPELANDRDYRMRFEREARIAAHVEHPNVVPVWDYADEGGRLYIAMRYVDGPDLGEVIAQSGRLAPRRAAAIIAQAAAGLDAAHARGLVHRDVKPGNILIERRGQAEHAWVTDFGLARAAAGSRTDLTRRGAVMGTLDFIAPEQLEDRAIDGRADIYALGCVLFYALCGRVVFPRQNDAQRMKAHLFEPFPGLPVPELQQAFNPVLARALAKRPEERFQHAGQLGAAVMEAARVAPVPVPQPRPPVPQEQRPPTPPPGPRTPGPPPQKPRRPRRIPSWAPVVAAVVAVLVIAVGALAATGSLGGGGAEPTATPSPGESRGSNGAVTEEETARLLDQYENFWESEDTEALLGLMAPDAIWRFPELGEVSTQGEMRQTFDEVFSGWENPVMEWDKLGFTAGSDGRPSEMRVDMRLSDGDDFDHPWATQVEVVRVGDEPRISRFVELSQ